jgi:hypothetical protein
MLFEPRGSLEKFVKEFNKMNNELVGQIKALLGLR